MQIVKNLIDESKYSIKCPYTMNPTRIVVHETDNDASAESEIEYMHNNNLEKSFHFAVDDKVSIQGIPLNRNAWHAGDKNKGVGNREGIAIEICYSKSGDARWEKAIKNAAKLIAQLLKERGWGIDKVTKHQDYSGKTCPRRILNSYGWNNFIKLIEDELKPPKTYINLNVERLERGAKGKAVTALQTLLVAYGYGSFTPDGSFGPLTEAAVIEFQKKNGTGVDGVCGVKTWNKLLGN